MSLESDLLEAFELHSPEGIRKVLTAGASPVNAIGGKRPIDLLIEMYSRSEKFADCLRVMLNAGATVGDPLLEAVLLDDEEALRGILKASDGGLQRKLYPLCAYTSCKGVSALHICAEFNSVRCATVLIEAGAEVDARADVDSAGIGGQTPLFHTVNSNHNYCRPMLELLIDAGADPGILVKALLWGDTMPWETVVFDITPISYAQCGLYSQFHRREADIYCNIAMLYRKRYATEPEIRNVPNKYLSS
jgi:hypothetical protein